MDKVKIGENEYTPPFRELDDEEINEVWVMDAGNNYVKVESVIAALNELAQLRAERDALKARVEELENTIDCGCNALTDSICCSGNDADTNLGFVRKMKRVLIGNNPTTPGGDE